MSNSKKNVCVAVFYLSISLFFFRGILARPGLIIGGDWGLPNTSSQMHNVMSSALYIWRFTESLFGSQAAHLNDYLFRLIIGLLSGMGVSGEVFNKFLLIFLFTLSGFSIYFFCRFQKLKTAPSILGGFFFITTPLFFDYAIMGWQFVLLSIALLPFALITFMKSVLERKNNYAILTGFLFLIAFWQSQSLVWYPLAFILLSLFIVRTRGDLLSAVRTLAIVFAILFLMNLHWLLPSLLHTSKVVSQPVSQNDISRFAIRVNSVNLLRLWGSLYNYQYEYSFPSSLIFITFIPSLFAYAAFILKRDRVVLCLTLFSLLPLIFFTGRELLQYIPFTNVIRDSSRFITLSTFAYSVLIAATLDSLPGAIEKLSLNWHIFPDYRNAGALAALIFVALIALNSYPFWTGELYGRSEYAQDIKLRTLEFPDEYNRVEKMLAKKGSAFKALYLPTGGGLSLMYDERFHGAYREVSDIYGNFSPLPGLIISSEKGIGSVAQDFVRILHSKINSKESANLVELLSLANIRYVIIRLNTFFGPSGQPSMEEIVRTLDKTDGFQRYFEGDSIVIFENTGVLPHVYSAPDITFVYSGVESLIPLMNAPRNDATPVFAFTDQQDNRSLMFLAGKRSVAEGPGEAMVERRPLIGRRITFANSGFNGLVMDLLRAEAVGGGR